MKNMKTALRNKLTEAKGFTLTEMIVVLAIIGILTAIIAPNIVTLIAGASETADGATAKNILTAAQSYSTDMFTDSEYTYVPTTSGVVTVVGSTTDGMMDAWEDSLSNATTEKFDGGLLSTGTIATSETAYIICDSTGIATGVILTNGTSVLATAGTGTDGTTDISAMETGGAYAKIGGYADPS